MSVDTSQKQNEELLPALMAVYRWADSRCPCKDETPDPCTLCGASVANMEACKSVESIFPAALLTQMRAAISKRNAPTAGCQKPVAWLRYWASQRYAGHGNIEHDEGLEVCEPGQVGDDGTPAFPVYGKPSD